MLYIAVSTSVAVVFWEIVYTRLGCYFLSIPFEASMLDLVSYYGYKFVGIIVTDVVKLLGATGYIPWLVFFYTGLCVSFFLVKYNIVVMQCTSLTYLFSSFVLCDMLFYLMLLLDHLL